MEGGWAGQEPVNSEWHTKQVHVISWFYICLLCSSGGKASTWTVFSCYGKDKCLYLLSILGFPSVSLMLPQVTAASREWKCFLLLEWMCASCSFVYTDVKKAEEQKVSWNSSFRKLFLFLNVILELKRKSQNMLHPKSPKSVDRRALCSTDLCRDAESLIFIQQNFPGSLANVVMLFPSYMQHFPVIAKVMTRQ